MRSYLVNVTREMDMHFVVHGVKAILKAIVNENGTGFIVTHDGVIFILGPMDEIVGDGHATGPFAPIFISCPVIVGIVLSLVFDNLIYREAIFVVSFRSGADYGFVLHVLPG